MARIKKKLSSVDKHVGILFSVFDGDQKHFDRFTKELVRLGYPFVVNFDHCCQATKDLFKSLPNFFDSYANDDPNSFFDESHRQHALDLLYRHGFDWALSLDVDETLERDAVAKITEVTSRKDVEVVDVRVLDLWGDARHYRVDGFFVESHREKLFNLRSPCGIFSYYHPTVHAPKIVKPKRGAREPVILKYYPIYVLHWGIMDQADVVEHTQRWDTIYHRKVGGNPYGFYPYINNPDVEIKLAEVPSHLLGE